MRLYNAQHQFYCGIDLHASAMYACVVDAARKKRPHENFQVRNTASFLEQIEPFRQNMVVGCESTFNWYWLFDLCES